ncbi:MAG: hypothetical protein M1819_000082 [Sarea resinae]|nr:MAG: hypothetical protein M1819_000082 [Sarea resinae]
MSTSLSIASRQPRPLSPASPPFTSIKPGAPSDLNHPRTPSSPPLMSATAPNHATPSPPTAYTSSSSAATTSNLPSSATPPSSVNLSQQPNLMSTHTFPTPASTTGVAATTAGSVEGEDQDGDVRMQLDAEGSESQTKDTNHDAMAIDTEEHRRSDHERHRGDEDSTEYFKGKGLDTEQTVEQRMSEETRAGLERLHADVGPPYLLLKSPHPPMRPNPTQDLLSLYGLGPLVATVARKDPVTGEKINRLRKSYEGKVKEFGLAGRNKAVKHPEDQPGGLLELVHWPDEEWQNQKVMGKEISRGFSDTLKAKLDRVTQMLPGPLPDDDSWRSKLGLDETKEEEMQALADISARKQQQQASQVNQVRAAQTNGIPSSVAAASIPTEPARPRRSGKKRSYNESSWTGYGDGFVDDEDMAGGYSTGDGEDGRRGAGSKKKRKRVGHPFAFLPLVLFFFRGGGITTVKS